MAVRSAVLSAGVAALIAAAALGAWTHAAEPEPARAPAAPASAPLEGRTFRGEIRDGHGAPRAKDVVTFKDGKFHSANCAELGFDAAPYWTRVDGETVHFLAESANPDGGKLVFRGAVRGSEVEWKAEWTKERWYWSIHREFGFKGSEKE